MRVRVGQYGARMYYGIPRALNAIGFLEKLYTDFTINKGLPKILSKIPKFSKIKNRHADQLSAGKIVHLPDYGIRHLMRMRGMTDEQSINNASFQHGVYLEKQMLRDGLKNVDAVCMVGSAAEIIFKECREKGIKTIEEQIIAPAATYISILDKYLKPYADWEDVKISISSVHYWQDVSEKEWAQCDYLLSGSEFVTESVKACGFAEKKIFTIPYGVPQSLTRTGSIKHFSGDRKLRVLFVGTVGIRKGIQYLLEIAKSVSSFCEIKICGTIALSEKVVNQYKDDVTFEGHISREGIGEYYEWADVFVLPTLFEGSATVCYEAIQYSLPIITTRNSGIFLADGEGVTIIPEANTIRLESALKNYFENPSLVATHSAMLKEKIDFASMAGYQLRLQSFFKSIESNNLSAATS